MASNEYSFDFSLPGNVSGGLQEQAALSDMPTFAEYYVDDELLAIPFGNTLPSLLADWIDVAVASYLPIGSPCDVSSEMVNASIIIGGE